MWIPVAFSNLCTAVPWSCVECHGESSSDGLQLGKQQQSVPTGPAAKSSALWVGQQWDRITVTSITITIITPQYIEAEKKTLSAQSKSTTRFPDGIVLSEDLSKCTYNGWHDYSLPAPKQNCIYPKKQNYTKWYTEVNHYSHLNEVTINIFKRRCLCCSPFSSFFFPNRDIFHHFHIQ